MTAAFATLELDYLLRGQAAPVAANLYLGLSSVAPTDDNGAGWTELVYTGYARKALARAAGTWTAISTGLYANTADVNFTTVPAGTTGLHAAAWGLWTAATGGVLITWGRFDADTDLPPSAKPNLPSGVVVVGGVGA